MMKAKKPDVLTDDTPIGRLNVLSRLMQNKQRIFPSDRRRFHELSGMVREKKHDAAMPLIEAFIAELEAL